MSDAVRVIQAFVLNDSRSRLLYTVQNGPQRPRHRVSNRVFDTCLIFQRIVTNQAVAETFGMKLGG